MTQVLRYCQSRFAMAAVGLADGDCPQAARHDEVQEILSRRRRRLNRMGFVDLAHAPMGITVTGKSTTPGAPTATSTI